MKVTLIERTDDVRFHYCYFCRQAVKGYRHVHYNTLESFLDHTERERRLRREAARQEGEWSS